ncbi:hypothetical protein COB52_02530 [Candidatus Kaiserbacteria bacterium]|nr:MAG: hypothetical protein COB52_02530 [Candidatus Kaiserbacteria bacterium]
MKRLLLALAICLFPIGSLAQEARKIGDYVIVSTTILCDERSQLLSIVDAMKISFPDGLRELKRQRNFKNPWGEPVCDIIDHDNSIAVVLVDRGELVTDIYGPNGKKTDGLVVKAFYESAKAKGMVPGVFLSTVEFMEGRSYAL